MPRSRPPKCHGAPAPSASIQARIARQARNDVGTVLLRINAAARATTVVWAWETALCPAVECRIAEDSGPPKSVGKGPGLSRSAGSWKARCPPPHPVEEGPGPSRRAKARPPAHPGRFASVHGAVCPHAAPRAAGGHWARSYETTTGQWRRIAQQQIESQPNPPALISDGHLSEARRSTNTNTSQLTADRPSTQHL